MGLAASLADRRVSLKEVGAQVTSLLRRSSRRPSFSNSSGINTATPPEGIPMGLQSGGSPMGGVAGTSTLSVKMSIAFKNSIKLESGGYCGEYGALRQRQVSPPNVAL